MEKMNPALWQYAPNNSPLPLPNMPFLCGKTSLLPLEYKSTTSETVSLEQLIESVSLAGIEGTTLDDYLATNKAPLMRERKPILLLGELANPFQLSRLNLGFIPVINVRISGLCRTYADGLDSRMIRPGVHHITLARTNGWWETTHLGFATLSQMKQMVEWLNSGRHGEWRPVKPNEGMIRVENEFQLRQPTVESMAWDGKTETCTDVEPEPNGPAFDFTQVMVPIHMKYGCYDSRGKIIRCIHVGQREFHTNLFRRGSSMRWQDILEIV